MMPEMTRVWFEGRPSSNLHDGGDASLLLLSVILWSRRNSRSVAAILTLAI